MRFDTAPAPHIVAGFTVPRVMFLVLLALFPVAIAHVAVFGPGLLFQLAVACPVALGCEAVALRLRRRAAAPALRDGSVIVTAVLLALALPPLLPWWLTAAGTAAAVLLGKHVYGGLGYNLFNPAMVGYAILLISFPEPMTRWPLPQGGAEHDWLTLARLTTQSFFRGAPPAEVPWDAWTGATALDALRTGLRQRFTMQEIQAGEAFATLGATGFSLLNLAALAGGVLLLRLRIIRWHIPAAVLAGLAVPSALAHAIDPGGHPGAVFHLFAGATMLCAFFIATDPVSAATSDRGRLIYGAGIGVLTWIIRSWGSYPDGVAFAVLLANLAVPLIDRYTVPRIYGQARR
jgi:Na+-translocating ferredoxin:NAD+ oxidoreductase subunit D